MKKKYLSALLFGALLFASAGTFTSCKDYDDDIDNLQNQVDDIKADLDDLQAQINAGKWITNVSSIDGGFTVTFSDGQSFNIVNGQDGANGADGADGAPGAAGTPGTQITIGEDGYWYFDGEKSDYLAVANDEDGKINVPYISEEDGYWYFYNEEGEAVKSAYKAVGAAYAVAANGGYYLYLPDENGEMNAAIFLPGAGASITDMELRDLDGTGNISDKNLYVYATTFQLKGGVITSASDWGGTKALPTNNSVVYSTSQLGLRINPANVDGTDVEYVLTNSQNNTLSSIVLKATEYKELVTSRAAYGNGLYTLKMDNTVLTESQAKTLNNEVANYTGAMFAVNADRTIRTDYAVEVNFCTAQSLTAIQLGNSASTQITLGSTGSWSDIKLGQAYTINGVQASALYDLYCEVDNTIADAYGVVFDNAKHTFTVNKNPDTSTTDVSFPMTVYTAANDGTVSKTTVNVWLSSEIPAASEYAEITKNVSDSNKTFSFDLATMKNGLSNLQTWNLNVNLAATQYKLYEKYENGKLSDEVANTVGTTGRLFTPTIINANGVATTDVNAATDIRVAIDNTKAAAAGVELEKTYYLEVTYVNASGNKLNSSVIPVKFTAPVLSDSFAIREGYVKDGVINAYFDVATGKTITLDKYFSTNLANLTGVTYTLDNRTTILTDNNTEYKTNQVVTINASTREINFVNAKKQNSQFELGYGVDLIIKAEKDNYEGWKYAEDADGVYTFKVKMMSPIAEGTVKAVNSTVSISANDLVNGVKITGNDITGADYNGNTYVVVPDKYDNGNAAWNNPQIQDVTMAADKDGYITRVVRNAATRNSQTGAVTAGSFTAYGNSLSTTTNVTLPITVTDAWGYTVKADIPVTINVN